MPVWTSTYHLDVRVDRLDGDNNAADTGGPLITDRWILYRQAYLHTQPVVGSLCKGSLVCKGDKSSVANGGKGYSAGLNFSATSLFAGFLMEGQPLRSAHTGVLYLSFLFQLNHLQVRTNKNLVRSFETRNLEPATYGRAQTCVRHPAERYALGQRWGGAEDVRRR